MQAKDWLWGMVELQIICADLQAVLNDITNKGIVITHVHQIDDITARITVPKNTYKNIKCVEQKFQCKVSIHKTFGLYCLLQKAGRRFVLIAGLMIFVFLSFYIQNHILFINISGDSVISEQEILRNVEKYGLSFGVPRKNIRSEQIKNILLQNIPKLQWVGINTAGCVATISVRERTETEGKHTDDRTPASIIASREGKISAVTASRGTILCHVGQQVSTGQVLISGTNSWGEILLMTRAQGEVFAQTERNLVIKTIPATWKRTVLQSSSQSLRIFFGKNLINLYNCSGILDSSCVKISRRYNLKLPNGFVLPVGICCERISSYSTISPHTDEEEHEWLLQQGDEYIRNHMIAGEILDRTSRIYTDGNVIEYTVQYFCKEMIGQIKKEELFCLYGKNS